MTLYFRAATSSLTDLEMKLNRAIERNVILGKYASFDLCFILTAPFLNR